MKLLKIILLVSAIQWCLFTSDGIRAQTYQQILATSDKNAILTVEPKPLKNNTFSINLSVQWVNFDLQPVEDKLSQIVLKSKNLVIQPEQSAICKSLKDIRIISFNDKKQLQFALDENLTVDTISIAILFDYASSSEELRAEKNIKPFQFRQPQRLKINYSVYHFALKNRIKADNEPPEIVITKPEITKSMKPVVANKKMIIKGRVSDNTGISELTINGHKTGVETDGTFIDTVFFTNKMQQIIIIAKDLNKNTTTKKIEVNHAVDTYIVWRQPSEKLTYTSAPNYKIEALIKADSNIKSIDLFVNNTLCKGVLLSTTKTGGQIFYNFEENIALRFGRNVVRIVVYCENGKIIDEISINYTFGKYYALLIGIEDYTYLTSLNRPIDDAHKLKNILVTKYTFPEENIIILENPTRSEIIDKLDELTYLIEPSDNLLIFYAGHGYWDKNLGTSGEGFWLPKDAQQYKRSNWIPNANLTNYIGGIKSNNTLLISDACFSGGIFRAMDNHVPDQSIQLLYNYKSRKAMTSGTLNIVPDRSVFIKYLLKRLDENTEVFLPARKLFASFEEAVRNNSDNVPQYGTIQKTGDEGGDFIFIKAE